MLYSINWPNFTWIAADLNRYQSVWAKFLQPLRALNCGFWGDKVQHVLWRSHNPPVVKSIKKVAVSSGTNNLNQDSPEDITDGIIDLASTFKSKYRSIKIFVVFSLAISVGLQLKCILKRWIIFLKQNIPSRVLLLFVQTMIGLFEMVLLN